MDEGDVLTTLKILIIGESGVGKSRWKALPYMDIHNTVDRGHKWAGWGCGAILK